METLESFLIDVGPVSAALLATTFTWLMRMPLDHGLGFLAPPSPLPASLTSN